MLPTMAGHREPGMRTAGAGRNPAQTGVCIIRAERQGTGLLITLRLTTDITNLSRESSVSTGDVEAALAAVRGFLREVAAGRQP